MSAGMDLTFETLVASQNLAALDVLLELLDHGTPVRRDRALRALLERPGHEAHFRILARYHGLNEEHRRQFRGEGSRLGSAIRQAYVDPDATLYANACTLIREIKDYDQSSLLIGTLSGKDVSRRADAIRLLEDLALDLLAETKLAAGERSVHDVEGARQRFLQTLRQAIRRFSAHPAEVLVLSFLLLAEDSAPEPTRILREVTDPAHKAMIAVLRRRTEPEVLRWFYLALQTPHPPHVVLALLRERDDPPFVRYVLDQIATLAEPAVNLAVRRLTGVRWLAAARLREMDLSDEQQVAAVIFAVHTGMPVEQKAAILAFFLDEGKTEARRAAACALGEIPGNDANQLITACLDDEDPLVVLAVVPFLRQRGLPHVMALLLKQLDHADERVREAARKALGDFSFERFIGSFDQMENASRKMLGKMMLRIDLKAPQKLRGELEARHRQHRLRATRIIRLLGLTRDFKSELMALLADRDRMVRREAIETLASEPDATLLDELRDIASRPTEDRRRGAEEALDYFRREYRPDGQRIESPVPEPQGEPT